MGLLPCLRRGSDRWWLPLSAPAIDALSQILLAHGRAVRKPSSRGGYSRTKRVSATDSLAVSGSGSVRAHLINAIHLDPALCIYAALCWPGEAAEVSDLADWLIENATSRFASGDAFLNAPIVQTQHQVRWNKLTQHFRTLPVESWMTDAHLWLEVAGPQVPDVWKQQWPTVSAGELYEDDEQLAVGPAGPMLQQLARMMQRQRSLEQSFDDRLHKSKLGALKQLAYGLSHEINNPLANISTRAQQLQRGEQDPTRKAVLQRIVDQVYRAHEMIADLMFYANPPAPHAQSCDLNAIVADVVQVFREEADRQAIRLELESFDGPAEMKVDATMIGEAVRALIRNSVDAIGCEGTIVVSLVRQEGRWLIHVADSGPGLSDLAREHAFDPYFSGREAGRGLGLGLCRAYRIAKLHTGDITLACGPTGCVATITLNQ